MDRMRVGKKKKKKCLKYALFYLFLANSDYFGTGLSIEDLLDRLLSKESGKCDLFNKYVVAKCLNR